MTDYWIAKKHVVEAEQGNHSADTQAAGKGGPWEKINDLLSRGHLSSDDTAALLITFSEGNNIAHYLTPALRNGHLKIAKYIHEKDRDSDLSEDDLSAILSFGDTAALEWFQMHASPDILLNFLGGVLHEAFPSRLRRRGSDPDFLFLRRLEAIVSDMSIALTVGDITHCLWSASAADDLPGIRFLLEVWSIFPVEEVVAHMSVSASHFNHIVWSQSSLETMDYLHKKGFPLKSDDAFWIVAHCQAEKLSWCVDRGLSFAEKALKIACGNHHMEGQNGTIRFVCERGFVCTGGHAGSFHCFQDILRTALSKDVCGILKAAQDRVSHDPDDCRDCTTAFMYKYVKNPGSAKASALLLEMNEKWGDIRRVFSEEDSDGSGSEGDKADKAEGCARVRSNELADDIFLYSEKVRSHFKTTHGVVYELHIGSYKKTLFAGNIWDALYQGEEHARVEEEEIRAVLAPSHPSFIRPIESALGDIFDDLAFTVEDEQPVNFGKVARDVCAVLSDGDAYIGIATISNNRVKDTDADGHSENGRPSPAS
jgi:hypothetical protein